MTVTTTRKTVLGASASPVDALAHFSRRLAVECDVSDVHTAMESGETGFVLIDSRGQEGWDQGHVPGAVHMPTAEIADRAPVEIPAGTLVVTYCWGPGCNGATKAALAFARLGYAVKEMIGGYEYWAREGFGVATASGPRISARDPLTGPVTAISCAC